MIGSYNCSLRRLGKRVDFEIHLPLGTLVILLYSNLTTTVLLSHRGLCSNYGVSLKRLGPPYCGLDRRGNFMLPKRAALPRIEDLLLLLDMFRKGK